MDRLVFERMNEQEATHWWFSGRREIIRKTIERLIPLPDNARILEAGCGTGGNLEMLTSMGDLDAFEFDAQAREIAEEKSSLSIPFGALPHDIPRPERRYDMIALFDVLEHIEDDTATLSGLSTRLSDGGRIFVTVPAFPWLWSSHDERHHHFRRYTRASLKEVAARAGLEVADSFYFNSLLLPLAVGVRSMKALKGSDVPDDRMPSDWVNRLLYKVFSSEKHLVGRFRAPFGLSVCAILQQKRTS